MKSSSLCLAIGLLICLPGCRRSAPEAPSPVPDSLLITDVRIVRTDTGSLTAPRDIWIVDGTIQDLAAPGHFDPGDAATVIPGRGLIAMAGLIDVHAHIGDGGIGRQTDADREGALAQWIRYGVTTIFVPGGGGGNDDQLATWKRRCGSGELRCPRLYGSGALLTAAGSHPIGTIWDMPDDVDPAVVYRRGAEIVSDDEPVDTLLDRKVARGVDALKIVIEDGPGPWYPKPRLSNTVIRELTTAGHARGLKIFAHVSRAGHVEDGVAAGIDGVMHSSEDALPDDLLHTMAEDQVFYVATLALYDGFFDQALGQFEQEAFALAGISQRALASLEDEDFRAEAADPPETVAELKEIIDGNLQRAAVAGVPLALGTDTNNPWVFPGYAVHEELALMVEAGLTPAQALDAATRGGAAFLGQAESLGQLAPGFEADLVLLRANPLDDIVHTRTLQQVIVNGKLSSDVVGNAGS